MPIKANGVEGSLSRFALKILFLRSDSGTKRKIFRCNPSGLDLYKRPIRSYLRIPFLLSFDDKHNLKSIIMYSRILLLSTNLHELTLIFIFHVSQVSARIFLFDFFLNKLVQVEVKTSKP